MEFLCAVILIYLSFVQLKGLQGFCDFSRTKVSNLQRTLD